MWIIKRELESSELDISLSENIFCRIYVGLLIIKKDVRQKHFNWYETRSVRSEASQSTNKLQKLGISFKTSNEMVFWALPKEVISTIIDCFLPFVSGKGKRNCWPVKLLMQISTGDKTTRVFTTSHVTTIHHAKYIHRYCVVTGA